jgi:phage N-6-adenine-methyltransferase
MANDNWRTPLDLFDNLNNHVNFDIDLCASDDYHLCELYYSLEDSCLDHEWGYQSKCFCNPPYSNITPFLKHAIGEVYGNDCEIWMLIPQNFEQYHHEYMLNYPNWIEAIYFINGRLSFLDENMEPQGSARPGSMLVHYKFDYTPIKFYTCDRDFTNIKKIS